MSDKLENFIRNNREKFDQQNPGPEVWDKVQAGLGQSAAAGTAAGGAAAKSGLAKLAGAWKLAAVAVATVATGTIIYFSTTGDKAQSGDQASTAAGAETEDPVKDRQKVEYVAQDASPLINPPLPPADIPYNEFTIDSRKGGQWVSPTGSVIIVPKGAFVDENGDPVKGDVTLKYREFHDGADILLSGIPMVYMDQGKPENFQTAGMMEILGFQEEKPIYIAEGKEIQVSLASFTEEDNYNLYYLNEESRQWEDIGKAELAKNKKKQEGLRLLGDAPAKPRKPSRADSPVETTDEMSLAVDYKQFPELKAYKKVRWETLQSGWKKKNPHVLAATWTDIKIERVEGKDNVYRFLLSNKRQGRTAEIEVVPMLDGEDYDKAMAEFRKKEQRYDKVRAQQQEERQRLMAQADMIRTFPVAGFGTYNCDRFLNIPDAMVINATIDFEEDAYMQDQNVALFHITGENRAVVTYRGLQVTNFIFSPSETNYLVTILPGGYLGVVDNSTFREMRGKSNRNGEQLATTLVVRNTGRKINNAGDIRIALGV